ncbi:MAG: hypothetical protein DRG39_00390 [Deltaproteobacteria bacterium]|nr:MAG: hypothetical protein DRG39_00390 [Deltaproteobacteria bacterium]
MPNPIQVVENIARVYESRYIKDSGNQRQQRLSSANKYVDEVEISIEGKKKQILENIVLEAIDELPTKTFEK